MSLEIVLRALRGTRPTRFSRSPWQIKFDGAMEKPWHAVVLPFFFCGSSSLLFSSLLVIFQSWNHWKLFLPLFSAGVLSITLPLWIQQKYFDIHRRNTLVKATSTYQQALEREYRVWRNRNTVDWNGLLLVVMCLLFFPVCVIPSTPLVFHWFKMLAYVALCAILVQFVSYALKDEPLFLHWGSVFVLCVLYSSPILFELEAHFGIRHRQVGDVHFETLLLFWASFVLHSSVSYQWRWMVGISQLMCIITSRVWGGVPWFSMLPYFIVMGGGIMVSYHQEHLSRRNFASLVELRARGVVFFPVKREDAVFVVNPIQPKREEDKRKGDKSESEEEMEEEDQAQPEEPKPELAILPAPPSLQEPEQEDTIPPPPEGIFDNMRAYHSSEEYTYVSSTSSEEKPKLSWPLRVLKSFSSIQHRDASHDDAKSRRERYTRLVEFLSVDMLSVWGGISQTQDTIRRHPLTRVFLDEDVETVYRTWIQRKLKWQDRSLAILFVIVDALFGLWDVFVSGKVMQSHQSTLLVLRFVVLVPLTAAFAVFVWKGLRRNRQWLLLGLFTINAACWMVIAVFGSTLANNNEQWTLVVGFASLSLYRLGLYAFSVSHLSVSFSVGFTTAINVGLLAFFRAMNAPVHDFWIVGLSTVGVAIAVKYSQTKLYRDRFAIYVLKQLKEKLGEA